MTKPSEMGSLGLLAAFAADRATYPNSEWNQEIKDELLRRLGSGEPPQPRCLTGDQLLEIALRHDKPVAGYQFADKFDFDAIAAELNAQFFGPSAPQPSLAERNMKSVLDRIGAAVGMKDDVNKFSGDELVAKIKSLVGGPSAPSGSAGQEPRKRRKLTRAEKEHAEVMEEVRINAINYE